MIHRCSPIPANGRSSTACSAASNSRWPRPRVGSTASRLRLSLSLHGCQPERRPCARESGYGQFDFPSHEYDHINRVGFEYQGDYSERTWAHTTFGYRVENENGYVGDLDYASLRPASV